MLENNYFTENLPLTSMPVDWIYYKEKLRQGQIRSFSMH